jgi:hypothetical protein
MLCEKISSQGAVAAPGTIESGRPHKRTADCASRSLSAAAVSHSARCIFWTYEFNDSSFRLREGVRSRNGFCDAHLRRFGSRGEEASDTLGRFHGGRWKKNQPRDQGEWWGVRL